MTKLYGRAVTLKEFKAKTNKYQILNVRGNYYYSYYSQIGDFGILLMIDLDKTDLKMTLDHYLNNLVRNDMRLERSTQDSFVWSDQEIFLSEKTNYGLRFIPPRSGWIDFLSAKWVSHILFILFIVFLIGLGGYQILSLRLEFRVLVLLLSASSLSPWFIDCSTIIMSL